MIKKVKLNLTFYLGALGVISWLLGNWAQVAEIDLIGVPYWYFWVNGLFLINIAIFVKVAHIFKNR